jgi:hypothetical protein
MRFRDTIKITNKFMELLAADIIDVIQADAAEGKFQNGKRGLRYKSEPYKKYKRNSMKSLRTGKKLKGFVGQSTDTQTSFVNMKLTGQTLRGMRASSKKDTAVITYDRGEIVLGNRSRGYDIYDLTEANKNLVMRDVEKLFERNIKKLSKKNIIIK